MLSFEHAGMCPNYTGAGRMFSWTCHNVSELYRNWPDAILWTCHNVSEYWNRPDAILSAYHILSEPYRNRPYGWMGRWVGGWVGRWLSDQMSGWVHGKWVGERVGEEVREWVSWLIRRGDRFLSCMLWINDCVFLSVCAPPPSLYVQYIWAIV